MLTSQKVIDAINSDSRREQANKSDTSSAPNGFASRRVVQYYAIAAHFAAEALPRL
jgi:hypothetical protein